MPGKYMPELSFHGSLHWQMESGQTAPHGLSATYIENAVTASANGWIYCSAGDTYSGLKDIGLGLDQAAGRLVTLKFWFGCYYYEQEAGLSRYRYDLCVYDEHQRSPFQFYALDTSRNGYLAIYKGGKPSDSGLPRGAPLWELKDLDPWELADGIEVRDLELISPHRKPVRRLMEDGFPYLNECAGHDTRFTLKISTNGLTRPW